MNRRSLVFGALLAPFVNVLKVFNREERPRVGQALGKDGTYSDIYYRVASHRRFCDELSKRYGTTPQEVDALWVKISHEHFVASQVFHGDGGWHHELGDTFIHDMHTELHTRLVLRGHLRKLQGF